MIEEKIAIIGSGPSGCTAAIYAARACLNPVLFLGGEPGGQLSITEDVENYPGFPDNVTGPQLMEKMLAQASKFGARVIPKKVKRASFLGNDLTLVDESEELYKLQSVIIATGAQAKWLGIPSEAKFQGFGVSSCATCDGFFFKEQDVIVVGGGNTAVEEALYLSRLARTVTVIHRRDSFRAEKTMQNRLFANSKIKVLWNTELAEVLGKAGDEKYVTGALLKSSITGEVTSMEVQGIFIAIGHSPNTSIFRSSLNCDSEGYIITAPNSTKTSVNGVFAAGDVQDRVFRQAITAAGSGCMAALEAEKFLA